MKCGRDKRRRSTLVVVLNHGEFGGEREYSVAYSSVLTPATIVLVLTCAESKDGVADTRCRQGELQEPEEATLRGVSR